MADKLTRKDLPVAGFADVLVGHHVRCVVFTDDGAERSFDLPEPFTAFIAAAARTAESGAAWLLSQEETFKPGEAAAMLGVSRPMIYKYVEQGLLVDRPVGSAHRITAQSVMALVKTRGARSDEAARLVRDEPDSPRVRAARERVEKQLASRQG